MAQPDDDLIIVASEDTTLPLAGTDNKKDPRDSSSREYVTTQGYDQEYLPCQEFNYILNNLGLWVEYLIEEYGAELGGTLSPSENLSDVDDATTSFDNIKQAATTSYEGVAASASASGTTLKVSEESILTTDNSSGLGFNHLGYAENGSVDLSDTIYMVYSLYCSGTTLYLTDNSSGSIWSIDIETEETTEVSTLDAAGLQLPRGMVEYDTGFMFVDANTDEFIVVDENFTFVDDTNILDSDSNSITNPRGLAYDGTYYYVMSYDSDELTLYIYVYNEDLTATGDVYDLSELLDYVSDSSVFGDISYLNGNFYINSTFDNLVIKLDDTLSFDTCEVMDASELGKTYSTAYSETTETYYMFDLIDKSLRKCQLDNPFGNIEIASPYEVVLGTSNTKAISPKGLSTVLDSYSIGVGQSWQQYSTTDDTSDYYRSSDTNYLNTTGRDILVSIAFNSGTGVNVWVISRDDDGVIDNWVRICLASSDTEAVSFVVPNDYYYVVTSEGPDYWSELR